MNASNVPLQYLAKTLLHEAVVHRRVLVTAFVLVNIGFVVAGLLWPKTFTSSATVYIEERNIIQPLMQGTAVASTTSVDRAKIAREVIFSRKILQQVMRNTGELDGSTSDREQEQTMDIIRKQTRVTNVGTNLVRIEYSDDDPQRAYKTTQQFAELFVQESTSTQTRESEVAFEFIDGQVKEYHEKLTQAEEALKEFRSSHVDARPGTEAQITTKISTLQGSIEKTTLELKEARIKQSSLEKQLTGEAAVATSLTREGQFVARIAELQHELDALRLSYHDTYPDIVRLKHQIEELRDLVEQERKRREDTKFAIKAGDARTVDETVRVTPIYQKLRTELLDTKTNIETLSTRLAETQQLLKVEIERANKMYGGEASLAELTRDYEVNRDIYHDLLKRRESARVSKNLDANKQGLTMRIQEPAALPLQPNGFRFVHFVLAGLFLSVVLPIGALFGLNQIDSRVRVPVLMSEHLRLPILATVPKLLTPAEAVGMERSLSRLAIAVCATAVFIVVAGLLKFSEVL